MNVVRLGVLGTIFEGKNTGVYMNVVMLGLLGTIFEAILEVIRGSILQTKMNCFITCGTILEAILEPILEGILRTIPILLPS